MGTFAIERIVEAPPRQVWDVVTDWAGYARWMPLTTMRLDPGATRVGWCFAGLTGLGPLRFSDAMRITEWSPPADKGRLDVAGLTGLVEGSARVEAAGRAGEAGRVEEVGPVEGAGRGAFRLVKVGRLLAGWAEVSVVPIAGGEHTYLRWRENIVVRPIVVGRALALVTDRVNTAVFTTVVDQMAAEAVRAARQDTSRPR